jgi:hypothetical protein
MGTVEEHEKRSQDIADTTRRVVITLNSGGIGLVFTVAGTLTTKGTPAGWALLPVGLFVCGLLFTGLSLFLAKHRELKRRDAVKAGEDEPEHFKKWYWRSFTWDLVAFAFFGLGAVAGLSALACISASP